jgi:aspartate aminotransferase
VFAHVPIVLDRVMREGSDAGKPSIEHGSGVAMTAASRQPPSISQRAAAIEPSATLAISAEARRLRAAGEPVISYGAGEPDFPTPDYIVEAAITAAKDPAMHHYTATQGLPELRQAVASYHREFGLDLDIDQIVVTNGAKQAVFTAFQVILNPGDEVLIPAPYWVTYPAAVELAGGVPVFVPSDDAGGFEVTVADLEAAMTERTRALMFVSPSNPTGAVYAKDRMGSIGRWAADAGIWVVTDEIYQHLVYGDEPFHSIPAVVPELGDRCLVISGVSKTYAMTGWRVGWLAGPSDVATAAVRVQSHLSSNVSNVAQAAALAALTGPDDAPRAMHEAFDRRRRIMVEMLNDVKGVTCSDPGGAFYTFPNMTGLLGVELGGGSAHSTLELGSLLLEEIRIAIVPGEAFGAPGYARFSFALADDELVEGIERLERLAG